MDRKWPPGRQSYGAPADGGRLPCAGGRRSGDPERNMFGEGKGTEHPVGDGSKPLLLGGDWNMAGL